MWLIDLLITTLVVLPMLTDLPALEMPWLGLVELSDFGVPILAAVLLGVGIHGCLRRPGDVLRAAREHLGSLGAFGMTGWLCALVILAIVWHYGASLFPALEPGLVFWRLARAPGSVFVVGIVAVVVRRYSLEPWERSFFLRQAMRVGNAWRCSVERAPALTLWGSVIVIGALFLWNSLVRHWAFESHGFDLGIFTNALWNLTHGNGYVSSLKEGINLFADHQSPLFWTLAPLFWAAPHPETLLAVQAFGLAAGGPALYFLGRAHFGRGHWIAGALPWLYWSYLPLRNANAFDFHPEVFMLPLFLWAFAGFASACSWARGLGILALVAALGAKESAPVVAVGLGIAWALASDTGSWRARLPGLALAAVGVVAFYFDVKVVPRMLGAEDYAYLNLYDRFGGGIGAVLMAPFAQPAYFFSEILNPARINFLFWTLAPLGFVPLLHWRAALAVLPPYLMLFLSEGDQRVRLVFHYGIEPGTALFWALPFGIAVCARQFGWQRTGIWMLFWAVAAHGTNELTRGFSHYQYLHADWIGQHVIPCLSPDLSTAASDSLAPHLARRAWISYPDQLVQKPSGEPVSCVVTDLRVSNWPLGLQGTRQVIAGLPDLGYREVWRCYEFQIHEFGNRNCMRCMPNCY